MQRAFDVLGYRDRYAVEILASSYAEVDDFKSAVQYGELAEKIAREENNPEVVERIVHDLINYRHEIPARHNEL